VHRQVAAADERLAAADAGVRRVARVRARVQQQLAGQETLTAGSAQEVPAAGVHAQVARQAAAADRGRRPHRAYAGAAAASSGTGSGGGRGRRARACAAGGAGRSRSGWRSPSRRAGSGRAARVASGGWRLRPVRLLLHSLLRPLHSSPRPCRMPLLTGFCRGGGGDVGGADAVVAVEAALLSALRGGRGGSSPAKGRSHQE